MADDQKFFMTYARSRPNELIPWIEKHNVPLLTNAIHRWSDNTDRFLDMWEYDTSHVIDAGGYNVMGSFTKKSGGLRKEYSNEDVQSEFDKQFPFYPYTLDEYHEWLLNHTDEFDWATVMDYACEERFDALWSYEERMNMTIESTIAHFDKLQDEGHPYKVLPVLQGRDVDDYVWFYEQLEDHGIPTDHCGLGTVCRMSSEKRIVEFEKEIRERTGVDRLHGFGVKIEAFKHGASFESADSQAWVYSPSNGEVVVDEYDRLRSIPMPDHALERTVESFKNYYSYVSRLQQGLSAVSYHNGVSSSHADDEARQIMCD